MLLSPTRQSDGNYKARYYHVRVTYQVLPVRHFSIGSNPGGCDDKLKTGFGSDQEGRLKEF